MMRANCGYVYDIVCCATVRHFIFEALSRTAIVFIGSSYLPSMIFHAQKHSRVVLTAEVETLLEDTIEEHIDAPRRAGLLSRLVEKLESDPAWVATYTVTGELHVPGVTKTDEEEEGVGAVLEVRDLPVDDAHETDQMCCRHCNRAGRRHQTGAYGANSGCPSMFPR